MTNCPKCHQPINSKVITCPHCGAILKAYGHPGITLHQTTGDTPLCETCTYHADDTCTFPQRPYAKECTLYEDSSESTSEPEQIYNPQRGLLESVRLWCQRNPALLGLLVLIAASFLLALMATS
ncbi:MULTISPECIES: zinc ribbon domain-containing protein [Moorena]|uniref:zinc ribbon domain-containing protein n=1 Tax=Moorena TaxID=1155738 RepID=UPI00142C91E4|nr:zinc ribbon domain-containing protein [Moorena sp. SIO4G3]NEO75436.1 hypothetical protein [Moorena sp. SIO4G3]